MRHSGAFGRRTAEAASASAPVQSARMERIPNASGHPYPVPAATGAAAARVARASQVFTRRRIYALTRISGSVRRPHGGAMLKTVPLKLLVVDDHAEFRRTVRQMFEGQDVSISEAASGEEAVRLSAAEHPDWVILDMRMPGMGGIKATQAIRRFDPRAQVIVISQFTGAEYREQARCAGALDFMDKENMSDLVGLVQGRSRQP
jgi:CheY-like chemotaxis protein